VRRHPCLIRAEGSAAAASPKPPAVRATGRARSRGARGHGARIAPRHPQCAGTTGVDCERTAGVA
jgi:hypothetical protein